MIPSIVMGYAGVDVERIGLGLGAPREVSSELAMSDQVIRDQATGDQEIRDQANREPEMRERMAGPIFKRDVSLPGAEPPLARLQGGGLVDAPAGGAPPTVGSQRRAYRAVFVRAGRARRADGEASEIEIPLEALRQALEGGLFDQRAVFIDHAGPWEHPSLRDLAGVTSRARLEGEAVVGEIELFKTPLGQATGALLDELLAQGSAAPDVGLSLAFYPRWEVAADGLRRVAEIRQVESIDLVFQPAAGGRILAALSARADLPVWLDKPGEARLITRRSLELPGLNHPNLLAIHRKEAELMHEDHNQLEGAQQRYAPATLNTPPGETVPPGGETNQEALAERWLESLSTSAARAIIAASGLPAPSQARLSQGRYTSPEQVAQAIEAERGYLAALGADQVIQVGGQPPRGAHISGMRSDLERLSLALDALIQGVRPPDGVQPLSGIREAYHLLSGDFEMAGLFQPERVTFANVTSSTMAGLVANALNKRLANEFQAYPQWWAPIVTIEDFTNLQDVRWITLGGVGELPTVAEGAAYTELSWDDKTETASFVKKGGYLGITLEAIDKDDVGRLRAAPRALAQAAWLTLSKAISGIFTANSGVGPAMSDGLALFHSSHANLGTTALSLASYQAARLAMRKQTELNSNERLGALTAPRYLLVPPDLEITALQVLASENDYSYALSNAPAAPVNPLAEGDGFNARMQSARGRVIVVDLWTDSNDWAAVADPRMYPTLGLGFRYGRAPEIFSVASPTAGLMFSNDTLPVKVRFFFAAGPVDYKGLYKANVA